MSRALSALRIGNFKAFADTQRIPLKPITLIFGPNSAGKSSIIQSLAFAHEAQFGSSKRGWSRLDVYRTDLGGASIDLGGFRQFVHKHDIGSEVEWGAEIAVPDFLDEQSPAAAGRSVTMWVAVGMPAHDERDNRPGAIEPRIQRFRLIVDGQELMRASFRRPQEGGDGAYLRLDTLNLRHPRMQLALTEAINGSNNPNQDVCTAEVLAKEVGGSVTEGEAGLLVRGLFGLTLDVPGVLGAAGGDAPTGGAINSDPQFYFWWMLRHFVANCSEALAREYAAMEYLGPLRTLPPRHFTPGDLDDRTWNAGGGKAWDRLARDEEVRNAVNEWLQKPELKSPYQLRVRELVGLDDVEGKLIEYISERTRYQKPMEEMERRELLTGSLADAEIKLRDRYTESSLIFGEALSVVKEWKAKIERSKSPADRERILDKADSALRSCVEKRDQALNELAKREGQEYADELRAIDEGQLMGQDFAKNLKRNASVRRTQQLEIRVLGQRAARLYVSHRDVGTGISQVLPVLVAAFGSKGQIVAIEQPEIHLHPALQAELADAFVESALGDRGNTFILETHSEHLILRLLRRIREKALKPDDVAVLYVQPTGTGSQVRQLEIDEDGDFIDEWPGGFFEESYREKFAGR